MLRVGVVGCGVISVTHLRAWNKISDVKVQGVYDVNATLAVKRAREFGLSKVYQNLDDLISECDIVDVCTPPQAHSPIALQAIRANKHLVIEKPVVTALADWERIQVALTSSTSQLAVIHNIKVSESVRQAKQWVDDGKIGDILRIQREFLTSPADDRMLLGSTHWSHDLPGGRWFETLPHELYLTHYFVGPLILENVIALRTPNTLEGAPADEVLITLRGENCLSTIHFSAHCQQNRRIFTLQGTRGRITVDILGDYAALSTVGDTRGRRAMGGEIAAEAGQTLLRWVPDRAGYLLRHTRGQTPHARLIQGFVQYLRHQGPHPTPPDEVDYVIRNCDAIGREIDRQITNGSAMAIA